MPSFRSQPVTLRDIARQLGLSHTTVGLALKNHPRITEERRGEIQAKARAMGYQPNPAAAALAHHKRNATVQPVRASLAWINGWPQPEQLRKFRELDFYWRGAEAEAKSAGYHLEEFSLNGQLPLARLEKILLARGIQGLLVPPHGGIPIDWTRLHCEHFSVVRFGRTVGNLPVLSVTSHQTRNAILAFQKIHAKGYRRIGFVGDDRVEWTSVAGFLAAQCRAPEKARLPVLLLPEKNEPEYPALLNAWLKKTRPDAILTDRAALKGLLKQAGLRVPEDIGLAGIGLHDCNTDSGIEQQPEEVGRVAAHALIALINANTRGLPPITSDILVNGTWVDGKDMPDRRRTFA